MVVIHVKNKDQSQFLYETTLNTPVEELAVNITAIYNGRLKIQRICAEIEELSKYGTMYPPEILGLTEEQVEELRLVDHFGDKCIPSGGFTQVKDPVGRRNGKQPRKEMQDLLTNTVKEAKERISKKLVLQDKFLTKKMIQEAIDLLRGAVMIVYPMKLPPHDVIRMEFENIEDLSGTQASLEVIDPASAQLWFCGKEMYRDGKLVRDYVGKIENCKDQSQFLYETTLNTPVEELAVNITAIYNGRLKIQRICAEIEELSKYGTMYPPEILGLTEEQVEELRLVDHFGDKCIPSGGFTQVKDPVGRRNGKQPRKEMQDLLTNTVKEAKERISKKLVLQDKFLTKKMIQEAIDLLRGAVMIVYPMKLPPHDVIRMEFENIEDLSGTQASLEVIDPASAQLWFCGKEMYRDGKLVRDYVGKIENCK
ncbi:hypothetical protein Trydic_g3641, partial [Trypoxylus dichotomus]